MPTSRDTSLRRGPVTDSEVVDFVRRAGRGEPDYSDGNRHWQGFRFPPLLMDRAKTRAEMEDVTLTSIMEDMLRRYAKGAPQEPEAVKKRLAKRGITRTRHSSGNGRHVAAPDAPVPAPDD